MSCLLIRMHRDAYITLPSFAMCAWLLAGKSSWFSFLPLESRSVRSYSAAWECKSGSQCPSSITGLDDKIPWLRSLSTGRVIAQVFSRLLPTVAARVRAQVRSCGIRGGQSDIVAGFLQVLQYPLPILIPPTAPHSSSIIRGWYNRSVSGRHNKWTQSHPSPRN
jgi:hypothetical protein